jgi:hypothetical protein
MRVASRYLFPRMLNTTQFPTRLADPYAAFVTVHTPGMGYFSREFQTATALREGMDWHKTGKNVPVPLRLGVNGYAARGARVCRSRKSVQEGVP